MDSYHKRKKVLEEYGKSINLKPFNDDHEIVDNKQKIH